MTNNFNLMSEITELKEREEKMTNPIEVSLKNQ